ncbi:Aspartate aminotransferase, cytoplasmic [Hypsibius exemplaris]|uniref:Aspartate aminotransferase n=1 Tax=Hypsibius exemplaris TaxID=2072580 RepID=A0A9X6NAJ8_HYPEX|nr:Aspartate aminotransferase, cytoplasmic [Hypsibius exemplaris]
MLPLLLCFGFLVMFFGQVALVGGLQPSLLVSEDKQKLPAGNQTVTASSSWSTLGAGVYRTEEGKPWILPVVKEAVKLLSADPAVNFEYVPMLGLEAFTTAATRLLLGADSPALRDGRAFGVQGIAGTGSLRIAADFLATVVPNLTKVAYISRPGWDNHRLLFTRAGFTEIREYRYWHAAECALDIAGMLEDLGGAPERSVVIFHACAHNPTGVDPTHDQWREILKVVKQRSLFPVFDVAYQGFASGDPDIDAWPVRLFVSEGVELLACQSFAKNFGLYNQRLGNIVIVTANPETVHPIRSQLAIIIRGTFTSPPAYGAQIVARILSDPQLTVQWKADLNTMSTRLMEMRQQLRTRLETKNTPGSWRHLTEQRGMFAFTGLNERQCEYLKTQWHIALLKSGRISLSGLSMQNVERVSQAFYDAVTTIV